MGLKYEDAGVNISRQDIALKKIKGLITQTQTESSNASIGDFGAATIIDVKKYPLPVIVSSIDGVGTKLYVANLAQKHDSVGYDLVSHCINDILTQGADPLFFLDYISSSTLQPNIIVEIISGMVKACKQNKCALVGGELAEMPGLYKEGEYDLVGSISGVVNYNDIINGKNIKEGDQIFGLPSIGLHTNGYSLARKILFEIEHLKIDSVIPDLDISVADELLKNHKCYYQVLKSLITEKRLKGIAHITGGGIVDNLPRILNKAFDARINVKSCPNLAIFDHLVEIGNMELYESYTTFNMGIGMIIVADESNKEAIFTHFKSMKEEIYCIGEIIKGKGEVKLI